MRYTPLPIPCDLTSATLDWMAGLPPPTYYAHVHPSQLDAIRPVIESKRRVKWYNELIAVPDATLAPHEWYIASGYGSAPAEPNPRDGVAYPMFCRNPDACCGKGYCPMDPTCAD